MLRSRLPAAAVMLLVIVLINPRVNFSGCKMGAVWQYSFAKRKTECRSGLIKY
jgi:hypothetical protein